MQSKNKRSVESIHSYMFGYLGSSWIAVISVRRKASLDDTRKLAVRIIPTPFLSVTMIARY